MKKTLHLWIATLVMLGLSACYEDTANDCAKGSKRCKSSGKAVESCQYGAWVDTETCIDLAVCNEATHRCETPPNACRNGIKRCSSNGKNVETCIDNRWAVESSCEGLAVCNDATLTCEKPAPVCTDGDKQCTPIGSAVDICQDGAWARETTCTELEICNPNTKTCDSTMGPCQGLAKQCIHDIVFACIENIWTAETACKDKTPTCNDGACVECTDDRHCFNSSCNTLTHTCRPISTINWCQSKSIDAIKRSSVGYVRDPRMPKDSTTITANIRCGIAGQTLSQYNVIKGSYWMTSPVLDNQLLYTAALNSLARGKYLCLWTFSLPGGKTVACPPSGGALTDFNMRPTKLSALEYAAP